MISRTPSRRIWGHILAWLAIGLFLIQTLGGASFLARQVAPADPFGSLALQYLCTPTGKGDAGDRQQDPATAGHDHCLFCRGGWVPFSPLLPLVLVIALATITLRQSRPARPSLLQAIVRAHRSRAPPLPA